MAVGVVSGEVGGVCVYGCHQWLVGGLRGRAAINRGERAVASAVPVRVQ
jgi:hypothetical protein